MVITVEPGETACTFEASTISYLNYLHKTVSDVERNDSAIVLPIAFPMEGIRSSAIHDKGLATCSSLGTPPKVCLSLVGNIAGWPKSKCQAAISKILPPLESRNSAVQAAISIQVC